MLRVYSVNRAACKVALSTTEAIPQEIGREVTMMLREVMMVTESKSNHTTFGDLLALEPSRSSRGE
jgi:hypothetical protein